MTMNAVVSHSAVCHRTVMRQVNCTTQTESARNTKIKIFMHGFFLQMFSIRLFDKVVELHPFIG